MPIVVGDSSPPDGSAAALSGEFVDGPISAWVFMSLEISGMCNKRLDIPKTLVVTAEDDAFNVIRTQRTMRWTISAKD
jgi:hypothetical protein